MGVRRMLSYSGQNFGMFPLKLICDVGSAVNTVLYQQWSYTGRIPTWPRYLNVTDRWTDNLPWQYRTLHSIAR